MRLFAGIDLPERVRASLEPLLPTPPAGVRAVPSPRWHITLAFYGEVPDTGLQCLRQRLADRLARVPGPAPTLRIAGGGTFGGGAVYLRVVGASGPEEERFAELARHCRRVGLRCRAPGAGAREAFSGHVTVARARRREPLPADYLQALQGIDSPVWQPRHIDLVQSILAEGPRYEVLGRFELTGG